MTERQLGFIGVGKMGSLMARRLIDAGHRLVVFDTNESAVALLAAAGAAAAGSVREVADRAEVVFASLPTPEAVRSAALDPGGIAGGSTVKAFIDTSTTGPRVAQAVTEVLRARNIASIECPVSGGLAGARDGTLTLMISGPRDVFDGLQGLLRILGKPLFVDETPGAAQTVKLANNLLVAAAMTITAEALVMGVKARLQAPAGGPRWENCRNYQSRQSVA